MTTIDENKFGARIDLNTKSTGNWTWYYNFTNSSQDNPGLNGNPNFPYTRPFRAQQGNFSNTRLIGPTMVNEFRINATRSKNPGNYATGGLGKVSSFGFVEGGQGILPSRPAIEGVPLMSFSSGLSMGAAIQDGNYQTAFQFSDAFSKTWGRHTFKFGGALGYAEWARRGGPDPNGVYTIDGGQSGNQFVDYLLGIPSGFTQSSAQSLDARSKMGDLFAQDSFRLSSNLTVNSGCAGKSASPGTIPKAGSRLLFPVNSRRSTRIHRRDGFSPATKAFRRRLPLRDGITSLHASAWLMLLPLRAGC